MGHPTLTAEKEVSLPSPCSPCSPWFPSPFDEHQKDLTQRHCEVELRRFLARGERAVSTPVLVSPAVSRTLSPGHPVRRIVRGNPGTFDLRYPVRGRRGVPGSRGQV